MGLVDSNSNIGYTITPLPAVPRIGEICGCSLDRHGRNSLKPSIEILQEVYFGFPIKKNVLDADDIHYLEQNLTLV